MPEFRPDEVAAYLRVSSRTQDVATQRATIERAAKGRGETVGQWFSEKRSGKNLARPELDALRAAVQRGEVRRLYVFKLDRLCRSGVRDMFELVEGFHRAGCELVAVHDSLDFSSPLAGKILLAVLAICAEVERNNILERTAEARARVEEEGGHWGRRPRLEGEKLARARELQAQGRSIRQIAQGLGVPKSSVQRSLKASGAAVPKTPRRSAAGAPSER